MKNRLYLILVLLITMTLVFSSCNAFDKDNDGDGGSEDGATDGASDGMTIVYSDLALKDLVYDLYVACDEKFSRPPNISNAEKEPVAREIVFGKTDRDISVKAYDLLERMDRIKDSDVGYYIYTDGSSVAIAFDDDPSGLLTTAEIALDVFIDTCLVNADVSKVTTAGTIASKTFDLVEYQEAIDQIEVDKKWAALEAAVGEGGAELVEAMKQLYGISTDGLVKWFANLYEPNIGGYYYSNSGRNTNSYLPDIESTAQALGFLSSSGILERYGNSYNDALPESMKTAIVKFLKDLQDPNGYFYHPQWSKELTNSKLSRLSRDLGNAVSVLRALGSAPTYDTPNGDKGDGRLSDGTLAARKKLTEQLGGSAVSAVSKVIPASSVAIPAHLKDKEAFEAYLSSLDIKNQSYAVGNTLTSQKSQIVYRDTVLASEGKDYSLMDILINWLNENQFDNGLWDEEENYHAVNGLMKIGGVYGSAEVLMPRADQAVRAAIRAMTTDEEPGAVTDVYNTWFAVNRTLRHMRDYGTDADGAMADTLQKELYAIAPDALRATVTKLSIFKKEDGSFSYSPSHSSANSQGCPVAVPGTNEGDVNATVICTSDILNYIYGALGLTQYKVPILTHGDWIEYRTILINLGPVIKDDEKDTKDPVTFDDESVDETPTEVSVISRSSGFISVIEDPRGAGNVVKISSNGDGSDYIEMACTSPSAERRCNVFEADFCMLSSSSSYPVQIFLGDSYMFTFRTSGNKVSIVESTSASSSKSTDTVLGLTPAFGEWFNVRVEYYVGTEDTVRIKFYYNGKLAAVTDGYFDSNGTRYTTGAEPSSSYGNVQIYVLKSSQCELLVDNMYCYKTNDKYTPVNDPLDPPINIDAPEIVYETDETNAGKGKYFTDKGTDGTRYGFSEELGVDEMYSKTASSDPTSPSGVSYKDGKLRVENGTNWRSLAFANLADKVGGAGKKYVLEYDFTWLAGKQSEASIKSGAAFVGLLGEHESVDNNYMFSFGLLEFIADDPDAVILFGQKLERYVTYNIRLEYIIDVGTVVYVNGEAASVTPLSVGKSSSDSSFTGFGFYFRKDFESTLKFNIDNVYMNTVDASGETLPYLPPTPPTVPTLDKDFETYFDDKSASGTRYDFSENITLEVYNKDTAPNGILSGALSSDSQLSFNTDRLSYLTSQLGALEYNMSSADWAGFTLANKGNTAGGAGYTYIFEADFTYVSGKLKSGTTDYNIIFAGMTSDNEANTNMARYNYISFSDKDASALTWHGYTFEKGKTYNVRIVSVVGGEYKFYVNGIEVYGAGYKKLDAADANTYAGFGFYFRNRCDDFWLALDNVFMASYAPGEAPEPPSTTLVITTPNVPTLPDEYDSFFDCADISGTRYDFSEDITLEVYNKDTAPNGIFAAKPLSDTTASLSSGAAELAVKDGVLKYTVNSAGWAGFTVANRGETEGGDGHTYVFEADLTYNGGGFRAGTTDTQIAFAGITTDNEDNKSYTKYNYVNYTDTDCSALSWHGYTFEKGVTYNVRIVMVVGGEYSFYVNNVKVAGASASQAGVAGYTFAGFGFYFRNRAESFSISLDNVFMANIAPTVTVE